MAQGGINRAHQISTATPLTEGARIGYESVRRGQPFAERMKTAHEQRNYERGRLRAVNMLADGLAVPPVTPTGRPPQALVAWIERNRNTGYLPHEGTRQPENPDLTFTRPHLDRRGFPLPVPTYCAR